MAALYQTCPKCGHQRLPADVALEEVCPRVRGYASSPWVSKRK
jgi:hypothetical protein